MRDLPTFEHLVIALRKRKYLICASVFLVIILHILYTHSSSSTAFSKFLSDARVIVNLTQSFGSVRPVQNTTITPLTSTRAAVNSTSASPTTTVSTIPTTTVDPLADLCDNISESGNSARIRQVCEQSRCSVLLRSSGGRLGNRMFMYASAYGLARTQNCRLKVDYTITRELSDSFQIPPLSSKMQLPDEALANLTTVQEVYSACNYLSHLVRPHAFKNIELVGYWQSYLYFDAYRDEIRNIFSARNETLIRVAHYLTNITRQVCPHCPPLLPTTHTGLQQTFRTGSNTTWVGVHIRRQDFEGIGYASDTGYVFRAMAYFRRRYHDGNVRFLIASDDKQYCHLTFAHDEKRRKVFVLPYEFSPADDLITLSMCHHSIVTGGTFGFWGAYLAGGEVIHDIKYKAVCASADYYPPWFVLVGTPIQKFE